MIINVEGKVLLSGYYHEVYTILEKSGWKRVDFETTAHSVGKTRVSGLIGEGKAKAKAPRIESLWISPNTLKALNSFI